MTVHVQPQQADPGSLLAMVSEEAILARADAILQRRLHHGGDVINSPSTLRRYAALHVGECHREVTGAVWLDNANRVIGTETLAEGTLGRCTLYPREIVRRALEVNAAGIVLYHNHPAGQAAPSAADYRITQTLRQALEVIEVRLYDHLIIGAGARTHSMSEAGQI